MDWTSVFAVIGALVMLVSAAVFVAVTSVLAWIGLRYVHEMYKDQRRVEMGIEAAASEWWRESGRGVGGGKS